MRRVFFTKSSSFLPFSPFPAYSNLLNDNSGDDDIRQDDLTRTHSKHLFCTDKFIHSDKVRMIWHRMLWMSCVAHSTFIHIVAHLDSCKVTLPSNKDLEWVQNSAFSWVGAALWPLLLAFLFYKQVRVVLTWQTKYAVHTEVKLPTSIFLCSC